MKKILTAAIALLIMGASTASAFDPKDIIGGIANAMGNTSAPSATETTTSNDDSSSSGILGALGSFINNTISNNNFTVNDLVGTWTYSAPAVTFETSDALKKIGGAAAATALEGKIEPYYNKLGFQKTTLTVDAAHNFTLKMGLITLQGTVEKDGNDKLVFNFSALGMMSLGKLSANATKLGSTLTLTFDATKFVQILTKVAGKLNISTLNTLTTLVDSYDGVYLGFKLKK